MNAGSPRDLDGLRSAKILGLARPGRIHSARGARFEDLQVSLHKFSVFSVLNSQLLPGASVGINRTCLLELHVAASNLKKGVETTDGHGSRMRDGSDGCLDSLGDWVSPHSKDEGSGAVQNPIQSVSIRVHPWFLFSPTRASRFKGYAE